MDSVTVVQLLEQLDDEIDDLEESLAPVLKFSLSEIASKLPLLDKAKLYVLTTYAIESVLFSYLRLNGVKAREHPVFKELTRVKQYFDKVQSAETPITKRDNLVLDKKAAGRIIKAGLSGNNRYDLERAEQQAKEKARVHIKFDQESKKRKAEPVSVQARAVTSSGGTSEASGSESEALSLSNKEDFVESNKKRNIGSVASTQKSENGVLVKKEGKKQKKKTNRIREKGKPA